MQLVCIEFRHNHFRYWGRLYKPEDVKVCHRQGYELGVLIRTIQQLSWHVPSSEEIDFALQIFKEIVEPALDLLEELLKPGELPLISSAIISHCLIRRVA